MAELGAVPGARLGLFTGQGHRLVATTVADDEGRFRFAAVLAGKHRLVVHVAGLCVANVPLQVVKGSRGKDRKQIVVHLRPAGIDSCRHGDYKGTSRFPLTLSVSHDEEESEGHPLQFRL